MEVGVMFIWSVVFNVPANELRWISFSLFCLLKGLGLLESSKAVDEILIHIIILNLVSHHGCLECWWEHLVLSLDFLNEFLWEFSASDVWVDASQLKSDDIEIVWALDFVHKSCQFALNEGDVGTHLVARNSH